MATAELATIGAGIGSLIPGVGNVVGGVVGGVIGAGIDIFNWFTGAQAQTKQDQLQLAKDTSTSQAQLVEFQTKAKGYQDFLDKLPVSGQALNGTTGDLEFDQQYRALLENYGNVNVMAGMTGRVGAGTTGAAIGQQASDIMSGFVTASQQKAQAQLDIYNASITSTQTGIDAMNEVKNNPDLGTQIVQGIEQWGADLVKGLTETGEKFKAWQNSLGAKT